MYCISIAYIVYNLVEFFFGYKICKCDE